jgi:hypothetical protein
MEIIEVNEIKLECGAASHGSAALKLKTIAEKTTKKRQ